MWKRKYHIKIYRLFSPCGSYFIGGCYDTSILQHFQKLKINYMTWKMNVMNRKKYSLVFGFFEKFGIDCEIKILYEYKGFIKSIKVKVHYLVDGLKNYKNCYNANNNVYKNKNGCYYLKF
jgi:hypothetical protein